METLLTSDRINVYSLIDNFVSYLLTKNLSPNTIALYIAALRSYFAFFDIVIVPSRFKRKVRMPKRLSARCSMLSTDATADDISNATIYSLLKEKEVY